MKKDEEGKMREGDGLGGSYTKEGRGYFLGNDWREGIEKLLPDWH